MAKREPTSTFIAELPLVVQPQVRPLWSYAYAPPSAS